MVPDKTKKNKPTMRQRCHKNMHCFSHFSGHTIADFLLQKVDSSTFHRNFSGIKKDHINIIEITEKPSEIIQYSERMFTLEVYSDDKGR